MSAWLERPLYILTLLCCCFVLVIFAQRYKPRKKEKEWLLHRVHRNKEDFTTMGTLFDTLSYLKSKKNQYLLSYLSDLREVLFFSPPPGFKSRDHPSASEHFYTYQSTIWVAFKINNKYFVKNIIYFKVFSMYCNRK